MVLSVICPLCCRHYPSYLSPFSFNPLILVFHSYCLSITIYSISLSIGAPSFSLISNCIPSPYDCIDCIMSTKDLKANNYI